MCDIRYFRSAFHCYEVAEQLFKLCKNDELYINDVAYNLQQCVEKTLKAFLECKGVTVPQTHSIHRLVSMSKNNGSRAVITGWIIQNQYEIETWESETRYNFDMLLEYSRIKEGLSEVKSFLDVNNLCDILNPEITDEIKAELRKRMPQSLAVRDDFEWNCYYTVLM